MSGGPVRLQKLLAQAGLASRRSAEEWIRAGRVTVNERVATIGDSADPACDRVLVDGKPLERERLAYWLLHKPRGVLTTTADPHAGGGERRIVTELLPKAARAQRLFPVGRLDRDSEGLLLLTNDGEISQALLHPSLGTEKEYSVTVRGRVSADTVRKLALGPLLEDGPMAPCRVGSQRHNARLGETTLQLTLHEGRKRQIRRALDSLGHSVRKLVRVRMGPLRLGTLAVGATRRLTREEVRILRSHADRLRQRSATSGSRSGAGQRKPKKAHFLSSREHIDD